MSPDKQLSMVYVCVYLHVYVCKCIQSFVERHLQDDQRPEAVSIRTPLKGL